MLFHLLDPQILEKKVMRSASKDIKRISLELGEKIRL